MLLDIASRDWSSIPGQVIPNSERMVLDASSLTLSNIR